MNAAENLLTVWSRLVVEAFWSAGVRQAVISPGSRSTPLLAALLSDGRWQLFSKEDERVASFFALGLAKATGRPPLLLCTSGSAGAHYYPAVLEAETARLPLVIVTADRPPELHGCGAPQTVDQQHLYGKHVRHFSDLGVASQAPEALSELVQSCLGAVGRSLGPVAGPVHLNMPARKPLEPVSPSQESYGAVERRLDEAAQRLVAELSESSFPPREAAPSDPKDLGKLGDRLMSCRKGLIVAGPRPFAGAGISRLARGAADLANRLGFVFAPEATSGLRFGLEGALPSFSALMRCDRDADLLPDLVLQIGRPPVATAWYGYIERVLAAGGRLVVISADPQCDPTRSAQEIVVGDPGTICRRLIESIDAKPGGAEADSGYRSLIELTGQRLLDIQTRCVSRQDRLIEAAAVSEIVRRLPAGALLAVGNSLPIRVLEEWAGRRADALSVDCQRGLSGIDGLVAGFSGLVAGLESYHSTAEGLPAAVLILGDVSALHDLGGFSALREIRSTPSAVVVLNNDGGRIFEQLPIQNTQQWQAESGSIPGRDYWLTRHGRSFAPVAELFGLRYSRPETVDSLTEELSYVLRLEEGSRGRTSANREAEVALIELPVLPSGHLQLTRGFEQELRREGLAEGAELRTSGS